MLTQLPDALSSHLVLLALRLIGSDAWPVTSRSVDALRSVSQKLTVAMQAHCTTVVLPTPLGFTAVRGLGLQEGQHLAGNAYDAFSAACMQSSSSLSCSLNGTPVLRVSSRSLSFISNHSQDRSVINAC